MLILLNKSNNVGCANDSRLILEGGPYHSKRADKYDFFNAYLNLTKEDVTAIAHQAEDMIKYCEYGGAPVNPSCDELINGSVKMFSPGTGVCYSFNFRGLGGNLMPEAAIYGGQEFGLSVILDLEGKHNTLHLCIKGRHRWI